MKTIIVEKKDKVEKIRSQEVVVLVKGDANLVLKGEGVRSLLFILQKPLQQADIVYDLRDLDMRTVQTISFRDASGGVSHYRPKLLVASPLHEILKSFEPAPGTYGAMPWPFEVVVDYERIEEKQEEFWREAILMYGFFHLGEKRIDDVVAMEIWDNFLALAGWFSDCYKEKWIEFAKWVKVAVYEEIENVDAFLQMTVMEMMQCISDGEKLSLISSDIVKSEALKLPQRLIDYIKRDRMFAILYPLYLVWAGQRFTVEPHHIRLYWVKQRKDFDPLLVRIPPLEVRYKEFQDLLDMYEKDPENYCYKLYKENIDWDTEKIKQKYGA